MIKPYLNIKTQGVGPNLVLLHGWGGNNAVFDNLIPSLSNYRVHCVDLPGFGDSDELKGDINNWCDALVGALPSDSIWLGWSLGGLVAMKIALLNPNTVKALVTVSSSPCFIAKKNEKWPGILPKVLDQFSSQLIDNLPKTVERFLAIQAMGSETAKDDIRHLKQLLLAKKLPNQTALKQGLNILKTVDLTKEISAISCPWLRIWGRLDGLIPNKIIPLMPQSELYQDVIFPKASHGAFISHRHEFEQQLIVWLETINGI